MKCAEQKTGDGEEREPEQESERATDDRKWTGRCKSCKKSEWRKKKVKNGA